MISWASPTVAVWTSECRFLVILGSVGVFLPLPPWVVFSICARSAARGLFDSRGPAEYDSNLPPTTLSYRQFLCWDKGHCGMKSADRCVTFTSTRCYQLSHLCHMTASSVCRILPSLAGTWSSIPSLIRVTFISLSYVCVCWYMWGLKQFVCSGESWQSHRVFLNFSLYSQFVVVDDVCQASFSLFNLCCWLKQTDETMLQPSWFY